MSMEKGGAEEASCTIVGGALGLLLVLLFTESDEFLAFVGFCVGAGVFYGLSRMCSCKSRQRHEPIEYVQRRQELRETVQQNNSIEGKIARCTEVMPVTEVLSEIVARESREDSSDEENSSVSDEVAVVCGEHEVVIDVDVENPESYLSTNPAEPPSSDMDDDSASDIESQGSCDSTIFKEATSAQKSDVSDEDVKRGIDRC